MWLNCEIWGFFPSALLELKPTLEAHFPPPDTAKLIYQEETERLTVKHQHSSKGRKHEPNRITNRICDCNHTAAHGTETQWRTAALRYTGGQISSTQRAEGSLGSTQLQRAAQQWREAVKRGKSREQLCPSLFIVDGNTAPDKAHSFFAALQQTHKGDKKLLYRVKCVCVPKNTCTFRHT